MPLDFRRVQCVFQAVAELPPTERAEVLERECGDDVDLRRRVEGLLLAHDDSGELPAANPGRTGAYFPGIEPGHVFAGRYKLREKLGEGGMGAVYVADQIEPVQRRVALKIIGAGLDSHRLLVRFEQERQALALMDHPNIAKIFDAGMDGEPGCVSTGRPYFAMELVKGLPLTRYCDDASLSPRQRLELFIPVCQAVQHAHQKGIIHRDLKPSNILVGLYDGRPVPKVIDFGVAKATGPRLTEQSLYTEVGSIIGTLEYMSPEQAELNNLDIDTRSDIYALGVILYELLTGAVPFSRKELQKAGLTEMLRVIKEKEPEKPSTKLSHSGTLPSIAAHRHMEPNKLTALVRGELDWIVMKALEKDRSRRYETANGFAQDIQRYLADEPVAACPPSATYKLRKFAHKNRRVLATAGAFLVLLVAGAVVSTWQAIRAVQAQGVANANADRARLNAEDAERHAQHARAEADAKDAALKAEQKAREDETKARKQARDEADAKDAALKAEQRARADETKARQQAFAALRTMTADVIERKFAQGTVLTEDDRKFLRDVIAQYDAFAAIQGDDADSRAVLAEGRFRVGIMRHRLGELEEAENDLGQAVSLYKQLANEFSSLPEFRLGLARSRNHRGPLLRAMGRDKEAENDYDRALSLYERLVDESPSEAERRAEWADTHNNRGFLLIALGRHKEAEKDFDQAVSLYKQLTDEFPARPEYRQELAAIHNNRGNLLRETARPKEADNDFDQSLSIQQRLADDFPARPEFRQDLAMSYNNRGNLLLAKSRVLEAEKFYDQALSLRQQLAADFPYRPEFRRDLARSRYNRARLLAATNRTGEAEQDYDQALSLFKKLGDEFPSRPEFRQQLAQTHNSRGALRSNTGRHKEAEKDYDQALSLFKKLVAELPDQPDLHNDLAGTCLNLAQCHRDQGDLAAAKQLLLEGRPHHLAALKANPLSPTYRHFYRTHLRVLIALHARLLEHDDAVRTAETCRDLNWDAPADAYDAASFLGQCIPIVAQHEKLDDKQRKEAVEFYSDAAMKLLREAVSKGYKDAAHMNRDANFAVLRQREDFQKLVAELQGERK